MANLGLTVASQRGWVFTPVSVCIPHGFSAQSRAQPQMTEVLSNLAGIFFTAYCCFWGQGRQPHLPGDCLNMQLSPETSVPTFQTHAFSLLHARMQYAASHRDPSPESCLPPSTESFASRELLWPIPLGKLPTPMPLHLSLFRSLMYPP